MAADDSGEADLIFIWPLPGPLIQVFIGTTPKAGWPPAGPTQARVEFALRNASATSVLRRQDHYSYSFNNEYYSGYSDAYFAEISADRL
jgi:hypothetical protein